MLKTNVCPSILLLTTEHFELQRLNMLQGDTLPEAWFFLCFRETDIEQANNVLLEPNSSQLTITSNFVFPAAKNAVCSRTFTFLTPNALLN